MRKKSSQNISRVASAAFSVLVLLPCVVFCTNFKLIIVNGDSMRSTLESGQFVLIRKTNRLDEIQYDDIVVFEHDGLQIKRVAAKGGDTLTFNSEGIFRNGARLARYVLSCEDAEYTVPDDAIYAIGDNYQNSYDSRDYGAVSCDDVVGVVIFTF